MARTLRGTWRLKLRQRESEQPAFPSLLRLISGTARQKWRKGQTAKYKGSTKRPTTLTSTPTQQGRSYNSTPPKEKHQPKKPKGTIKETKSFKGAITDFKMVVTYEEQEQNLSEEEMGS